ncbi:hypothetical protein [Chromobacterium subtsugae]|uniref:hypothetical protein n=1 Tax=Chromobacterium subtsugae TaxID=251747 RepID=UPI000A67ED79|nr:hypothetical protein [Chromobacterium subtsugae]
MKLVKKFSNSLTILSLIVWVLFLAAAITAGFILINWRPPDDLTDQGFNHVLDIFKFPLTCLASVFVVMTVRVAVAALLASTQQSVAATWLLIQSGFLAYVKSDRRMYIASLQADPFLDDFSGVTDNDVMMGVIYMSPQTTLRRLFSNVNKIDGLEPQVNPFVLKKLDDLEVLYDRIKQELAGGESAWLVTLADMAVLVRGLRIYLAVKSATMDGWKFPPVLQSGALERKAMPAFERKILTSITFGMKLELLCLADVFHFCQALEFKTHSVVKMAVGVGKIGSDLCSRSGYSDEKYRIEDLWVDPHRIQGEKINI